MYWRERSDERSWHDVAQICLNGHVINRATKASSEFSKKFCHHCGAVTITQCQRCNGNIQGEFHVPGVVAVGFDFPAPGFCFECGTAYPWTESKLKAARDLAAEFEGLAAEEKEALSKSFDDIVKDTANTPVAATRLKRLLPKIGTEGASALRDILKDIASDAARKLLWPS